jgi:hypothetical protein
MKRLLLTTLLGISTLAVRADFRDYDEIGASDKNITQNDGPVTGVFNLVTPGVAPDSGGFVPGTPVFNAVAKFDFEANGNFPMSFKIELDNILFGTGTVAANGALTFNGDGNINGAGPNGPNESLILLALTADGILNYRVCRTDENEGTLAFNFADLLVTDGDLLPPTAVNTPDAGSTLALAGIGLAAIASLRNKLAK